MLDEHINAFLVAQNCEKFTTILYILIYIKLLRVFKFILLESYTHRKKSSKFSSKLSIRVNFWVNFKLHQNLLVIFLNIFLYDIL